MAKCFIITPYGQRADANGKLINFDKTFDALIDKIIADTGLEPIRSNYGLESGPIFRKMIEDIATAEVCIADITTINPNVFYELGVRHALCRRVTVLTRMKDHPLSFDISNLTRRYVYVWADGVFLQARMEDHGECMLVLIGATPEGKKELIGFQVGVRESTQSWRELLVEAKSRGLTIAPELAIGDGALGFWKALDAVFPATRHQRCWVHKTANVLNKVALSVQANMKKDLREVYLAPNRASAEVAIDIFAEKYGAKYDKAVDCLTKDRDALLAYFEFPAEHWDHLRTTNPIESVFATVRHRTVRTKGSLSPTTARLMVFRLVIAASTTWRRLKGTNHLPKIIAGVRFKDGIEVIKVPATNAA